METAPLCFLRSDIPYHFKVHVELRRVWTGMRGGRLRSTALDRNYLGHRHQVHDGGAHDVAMFLWTQLCMSGFPPHPG
eukprot:4516756-Pyramimonas_sp.AAC.1